MDRDFSESSARAHGWPSVSGVEEIPAAGSSKSHDISMRDRHVVRPPPLFADSDAEYFNVLSQIPGMWGCKNPAHEYIYASLSLAQLLGFTRHEDIYGCADWNVPCNARECADAYHAQDRLVMQKRVPLRILDVAQFAGGEWRAQITTKFPLFDRQHGIIGVSLQVVDATSLGALELRHLLDAEYRSFAPEVAVDRINISLHFDTQHKMTARESEVLFFMLRGHNAKMIAKVLEISHRTIEHHIDSLKYRFGVSNKFDLVYAAIARGYLNFLPPLLLRKQRSIVLGELRSR